MGCRAVTGGPVPIDHSTRGGAAGVRHPENLTGFSGETVEGEHQMNSTTARRAGVVAFGIVAGLVVSAAPALAANPAGVASLGFVEFTRAGRRTSVPVQAPCAVDG